MAIHQQFGAILTRRPEAFNITQPNRSRSCPWQRGESATERHCLLARRAR